MTRIRSKRGNRDRNELSRLDPHLVRNVVRGLRSPLRHMNADPQISARASRRRLPTICARLLDDLICSPGPRGIRERRARGVSVHHALCSSSLVQAFLPLTLACDCPLHFPDFDSILVLHDFFFTCVFRL